MERIPFCTPEDATRAVEPATAVVRGHGVLMTPTETFYGLAADPRSERAVARVLELKQRPRRMALPVLAADWHQVETLVVIPERFRVRLSRTWPGPLTVVLPCREPLPAAPSGTLAVRIPGLALLRSLLYRTGPLTGTSANLHGSKAVTLPDQALASLAGTPDLVLDGGSTDGVAASTMVDLTGPEPRVLRVGSAPWV
jgi:tRNA threonylcarbamoyl adenosine modification protein (Sua5/YciO/YrdC/YwlC family)